MLCCALSEIDFLNLIKHDMYNTVLGNPVTALDVSASSVLNNVGFCHACVSFI